MESSPSLCRFLRYVVEETLAGRGGMLKEYSLGTEVFARGEQFDPRLDPIVRVQARNLRARLAKYYDGPGLDDAVLIELPKRTYVPVFQLRAHEELSETPEPPGPAPSPEPVAAAPVETPSEPVTVVPERENPWKSARALTAGLLALLVCGAILWPFRMHKVSASAADPMAQDLYIRGRFLLDRGTEEKLRESIHCFEQAIARKPSFAPAYAGLADAYDVMAQYGYMPPPEGMEQARKAAQKALEIDPYLAEAHVSLAAVLEAYDWKWTQAEQEYRRAIQLNPNLAAAHQWYGMFLRDQGRTQEALPELRRAAELSPVSVMTSVNLSYTLMMAGDHRAALEQARFVAELAPDLTQAQLLLAKALMDVGKIEESQKALNAARDSAEGHPHEISMVAAVLAHRGRKDETARMFKEMQQLAHDRYVSPSR